MDKCRACGGPTFIVPKYEPKPKYHLLVGGMFIFAMIRWTDWAVGFQLLGGGLAITAGPLMLGVVAKNYSPRNRKE